MRKVASRSDEPFVGVTRRIFSAPLRPQFPRSAKEETLARRRLLRLYNGRVGHNIAKESSKFALSKAEGVADVALHFIMTSEPSGRSQRTESDLHNVHWGREAPSHRALAASTGKNVTNRPNGMDGSGNWGLAIGDFRNRNIFCFYSGHRIPIVVQCGD
jgi:hypothetical protein